MKTLSEDTLDELNKDSKFESFEGSKLVTNGVVVDII